MLYKCWLRKEGKRTGHKIPGVRMKGSNKNKKSNSEKEMGVWNRWPSSQLKETLLDRKQNERDRERVRERECIFKMTHEMECNVHTFCSEQPHTANTLLRQPARQIQLSILRDRNADWHLICYKEHQCSVTNPLKQILGWNYIKQYCCSQYIFTSLMFHTLPYKCFEVRTLFV